MSLECVPNHSLNNSVSFSEASSREFVTVKQKPVLYRYERGGILIYDSKARIAGSSQPIRRLSVDEFDPDKIHDGHTKLTTDLKRELERAPPHGS
jgi:hypothetical protein